MGSRQIDDVCRYPNIYYRTKKTAHSQGKALFFFILRVQLFMKRCNDGVIQEIVDPFYFAGPLRIEHLRMS